MVLGPKLPDLLDQLFLRVLDVNLVDALRVLDSCRTPLARLVAITLQFVSGEGLQSTGASAWPKSPVTRRGQSKNTKD